MNRALRMFIYGLWAVPVIAIAAFLFSLNFLRYERPTSYERLHKWELRVNQTRMEREAQAYKAQQLKEAAERSAHLAKVTALNAAVETKWRADLEAAHATAEAGVVPPMLEIHESARAVTVTNRLIDQPVCVRLQRVARRSQRANDFDRCRLDVDTCRELLPHSSHRFQLYSTGNPPGCMQGQLEFRVGTAFSPEPSWWSRSALEDFDQRSPPEPLESQASESWPLRGNVAALNELLLEKDRAARWKRDLVVPGGNPRN